MRRARGLVRRLVRENSIKHVEAATATSSTATASSNVAATSSLCFTSVPLDTLVSALTRDDPRRSDVLAAILHAVELRNGERAVRLRREYRQLSPTPGSALPRSQILDDVKARDPSQRQAWHTWPEEMEDAPADRRFLYKLVGVLSRGGFSLGSRDDEEFARTHSFNIKMPIKISWNRMDADFLPVEPLLVHRDQDQDHAAAAAVFDEDEHIDEDATAAALLGTDMAPTFADRLLLAHRGTGHVSVESRMVVEKMDLAVTAAGGWLHGALQRRKQWAAASVQTSLQHAITNSWCYRAGLRAGRATHRSTRIALDVLAGSETVRASRKLARQVSMAVPPVSAIETWARGAEMLGAAPDEQHADSSDGAAGAAAAEATMPMPAPHAAHTEVVCDPAETDLARWRSQRRRQGIEWAQERQATHSVLGEEENGQQWWRPGNWSRLFGNVTMQDRTFPLVLLMYRDREKYDERGDVLPSTSSRSTSRIGTGDDADDRPSRLAGLIGTSTAAAAAAADDEADRRASSSASSSGTAKELLLQRRTTTSTKRKREQQGRVWLHLFRDVPVSDLELLLPHMSKVFLRPAERVMYGASSLVAAVGLAAVGLHTWNDLGSEFSFLHSYTALAAVSGAILYAGRIGLRYRFARQYYESFLMSQMYAKSVGTNEGALTYLLDAATQEESKRAAIAYLTLLHLQAEAEDEDENEGQDQDHGFAAYTSRAGVELASEGFVEDVLLRHTSLLRAPASQSRQPFFSSAPPSSSSSSSKWSFFGGGKATKEGSEDKNDGGEQSEARLRLRMPLRRLGAGRGRGLVSGDGLDVLEDLGLVERRVRPADGFEMYRARHLDDVTALMREGTTRKFVGLPFVAAASDGGGTRAGGGVHHLAGDSGSDGAPPAPADAMLLLQSPPPPLRSSSSVETKRGAKAAEQQQQQQQQVGGGAAAAAAAAVGDEK